MLAILSLSFAMFAGLMTTRWVGKLKLPDVTAFLIAGVLIGPYAFGRSGIPGFGFASYDMIESLSFINEIALGFIAFSIGNEFRLASLKETGRQAFVIGILQALCTAALVDIVLIGLHLAFPSVLSLPAAITLGAIATATAPAATLMVVRQYKAKGRLVDLLLPIVALDDAVGLVIFAVSFGIARAISSGSADIVSILINPLVEITCSLALGTVAGAFLTHCEKFFRSNSNRLALVISMVLLTVGLSMAEFELGNVTIGFSSLLVCMMTGSVFCNLCSLSEDLMTRSDKWSSPLLILFFVISGAELDLSVFSQLSAIAVGVIYILSRCAGKYLGARESAKLVGCDRDTVNYLGITLFPQAGVALGMCITAGTLPGDGALIRSIVLFAVLIYELVGPVMTKWALTKAGNIVPPGEDVTKRRENMLADVEKNGKRRR